MDQAKEIRFTTFIDEHTECEVYATVENGDPVIQTVNIIGDCVVTFDDLDDEGKEFFMSETRRIMAESHRPYLHSTNQAVSLVELPRLRTGRGPPGYPKD